jgi:hypothetical protein
LKKKKKHELNLIPIGAIKAKSKIKQNQNENPSQYQSTFSKRLIEIDNNKVLLNPADDEEIEKTFDKFLLALYDENTNTFISICFLDNNDKEREIPIEIPLEFYKNFIKFYPKNYIIPNDIKPDFLFKPVIMWRIEFEDIVDSDVFAMDYNFNFNLKNNDYDNENEYDIDSYINSFDKENYGNLDIKKGSFLNSSFFSQRKSFKNKKDVGVFEFNKGKTILNPRFDGENMKLDVKEVSTLNCFKRIYRKYYLNETDLNV